MDSHEKTERVFHPLISTAQGEDQLPFPTVEALPPQSQELLDPKQTQNRPTSFSLVQLLCNPSKGSPAKASEPAHMNISEFSKSSASNGNLLQSHKEGNNSTEKKLNTQLSIALWQPQRQGDKPEHRDKLPRRCSFS